MARRFRFRLQPVLRYREMIETEKKKDFALANRAVEEERLRREALQQDRGATQADVRDLYAGGAPFQQVVEAYRYINTLDLQLVYNAQRLAKLAAVREEKRKLLMIAQRDRKALDLLRERRREDHAYEVARAEQTELDALAVQAKRRRDREEE